MQKLGISIALIAILSGCASMEPAPDHVYRGMAQFAAQGQKCFNNELISVQEMAETRNVVAYTSTTWAGWDNSKFNDFFDRTYPSLAADSRACRNFQSNLISARSSISNREIQNANSADQMNRLGESLKGVGDAFRPKSPAYCQRIGSMVSCY